MGKVIPLRRDGYKVEGEGQTVEHKLRPGEALIVVSGPEAGLDGDVYRVTWGGRKVKVKKSNLII